MQQEQGQKQEQGQEGVGKRMPQLPVSNIFCCALV
jgi:hypothetical protein